MDKDKKVLKFPNKVHIEEEAAGWVARTLQSELSGQERRELQQWADQSALHRSALLERAKLWDDMEKLKGLSKLFPLEGFPGRRSSRSGRVVAGALAAASLAFMFVVFYYSDVLFEGHEVTISQPLQVAYETPVGGQKIVELEDGSIITLNTATRISVHFSERRRAVTLHEGEAYFDVAHKENVPFVVTVDATSVWVVGTAFAIYKQPDRVEITVTDGLVEVKHPEEPAANRKTDKQQPVLLRPGQMGQFGDPGLERIEQIDPDQLARKLSWQQNILVFDRQSLEAVIREFSRYTNIKIQIADQQTASIQVGGYFHSNDIAGLLTSLENNFDVSVTQLAVDEFRLSKFE